MQAKSVISLAAGISQKPLMRAAKDAGFHVIAIDRDPKAPGLELADKAIRESTHDTDKVLNALQKLKKEHQFGGLLARTSGPALYTAAAIVEEFNLSGVNRRIVPLATQKSKLREFSAKHGILMPIGQKITNIKDLELRLTVPLVVKPDIPLIGKKDVSLVYNDSELETAVDRAIKSSANGCAEVEKYIEGVDASILFVSRYGQTEILYYWDELIGVTKKKSVKGIGVSVPSVLEYSNRMAEVEDVARIIGKNFDEINALIILSFKVDFSGNPYLIEMHGDLGGDLIADVLLPIAYPDHSFFELALEVAVGNKLEGKGLMAIPTCLIYDTSQFNDGLIQHPIYGTDSFYIQEGDLSKNLKRLDNLLNRSLFDLAKLPLHGKWLKDNSN